MKHAEPRLLTPIHLKTDDATEPPDDEPVCHVLARNGLFIRRQHAFFKSCVAARDWPSELAAQTPFLELHCPKVPQAAMERIVGFFFRIAQLHGSEAAAILFWERRHEYLRVEIPTQRATVTESWSGCRYATDVRYETPQLGPDLSLFGSVHSHVDGPAYASSVDRHDESHLTGLHIVVGRIREEPPAIHCEYVVDGVRFQVDTRQVIEGYQARDTDIPGEWIDRVAVDVQRYESRSTYYDGRHDRGPARRKFH